VTYSLVANFVPAPEFAMAQYVSHGLIDPGSPLSDASDYSEDTWKTRTRMKSGMPIMNQNWSVRCK
jgi:hypothetical protein